MGRPKAVLPFGPEAMGARVARLVAAAVHRVVVVAGRGQELPEFPPGIEVLRDRQEGMGPLEGLAVGLWAVRDQHEAAFVAGCDLPLLRPEFVRRMIRLSVGYDICLPHVNGYDEPLAAVYHANLLPLVESLLAAGRLRPAFLFDRVRTRRVTAGELVDVDPHLHSLTNLNGPEDYRAALAKAGFSAASNLQCDTLG